MPIPMNTSFPQLQELDFNTCLPQISHGTMIVHSVITRFRCDKYYGHRSNVHQTPCRLRLTNATRNVRIRRADIFPHQQRSIRTNWRFVSKRQKCQSERTIAVRGRSNIRRIERRAGIILKSRSFGLESHECFYKVRSDVGKFPSERTALAVSNHHRRADFVEQSRVAGVVVARLESCVALRRHLRGVEGVESRVSCKAVAGPLRVEICLGV